MHVPSEALVSLTLLATGDVRPINMSSVPKIVRSLASEDEKSSQDASCSFQTHLVVHFDINETVLVGDEAGGDTREDSLNKILAKSAFVQIPSTPGSRQQLMGKAMDDTSNIQPTHWWDGTKIDESSNHVPPLYTGWHWPPGCCPYYRTAFKKRAKRFVEGDGKPYRPLYHTMQQLISFPHESEMPPVLSHLLAALFETIQNLTRRSQPVRFVFRTFGTDLPEIAEAVTAFCHGKHPDYPHFCHPQVSLERLFKGRWTADGVYELLDYVDESLVVARGDAEIVALLDSLIMCGIQDDYEHWAAHGWEPWAGKPVWVPSSTRVHHVLLDDNIHNIQEDSIASVRKQHVDGTYRTLSGREILEMQGVHLIRVPTLEPILNPQWFVQQLDKAQARYAELRRNSELM
jgi:hypothetical protein